MRRATARAAGLGRGGRCPSPGRRLGSGRPGLEGRTGRRRGGLRAARGSRLGAGVWGRAPGRGGPPGAWRGLRTRPRESVTVRAPPRPARLPIGRHCSEGQAVLCLCVFVPPPPNGSSRVMEDETSLWFDVVSQLLPSGPFFRPGAATLRRALDPETRRGESARAFCREHGWPVGPS